MLSYILVDAANMFFRARHVVQRGADPKDKIGMAYHIMFASINKVFREQKGTHVVLCLEGRSWRKDAYEPYKRNRSAARAALTVSEQEEDRMFWDAFDELKVFFEQRTNCTVLQQGRCEADDFIARWIQNHPDDKHCIVSSDSDFYQLLNKNVQQYNGITGQLITVGGIFDDRGRPVIDKKTKEAKELGDPQWLLFEKCIRGDTSDNVFSACPGARKKGTKNKVGMMEAFADKDNKGYNWNNFMLQRWTDHEGVEHRVLEDYQRNMHIIDLTAQPDDIKEALDGVIVEQVQKESKSQVGIHFMKLCGKWGMQRTADKAQDHAEYLNKAYSNA
jgi:5'-3' exonuclease|tara:strand:- start:502 stop:1497 length:996 start_codon:yes stop_codon:yes gene_type:complete